MGLPTRLVILGKQGAGKGTQAIRLSQHYEVPRISTGDMFRMFVKERDSEIGRRAKKYMEAGDLVPDEVVNEMVRERLTELDRDRQIQLIVDLRRVHRLEPSAARLLHEARGRVDQWPLEHDSFDALHDGLERTYRRGRRDLGDDHRCVSILERG